MFILVKNSGYPTEIARFYAASIHPFQVQMEKLEEGNILSGHLLGRTRVFTINPRYPFLKELKALLQKALSFYPELFQKELANNRRRPRRSGKPL